MVYFDRTGKKLFLSVLFLKSRGLKSAKFYFHHKASSLGD